MAMDHVIQKAAGTSQWSNGEGLNFLSVSVVILQFFIIAEMVIYLILFHHIYIHNKNMRNSKSGTGTPPLRWFLLGQISN